MIGEDQWSLEASAERSRIQVRNLAVEFALDKFAVPTILRRGRLLNSLVARRGECYKQELL
jgi:hypothetical protein